MKTEYDPMVLVAANRGRIVLKDGRSGTLLFWSTEKDAAVVLIEGRHIKIVKDDIGVVVGDED